MRYLLISLFVVVLFTPVVLRWALGMAKVEPKQKDALELVIITPHSEPIRREFEEAFSAWHQQKFGKPVDIQYLSFGASDVAKALESRFAAKSFDIDLAWGGGDNLFDRTLKPYLAPLELDPAFLKEVFPAPNLAGLPLYEQSTWTDETGAVVTPPPTDPTTRPNIRKIPLWYGTALSTIGHSYNRDVLKQLGLPEPKTWKDLADPRYRGWIVMADPTRSSSAKQAFMVIVEREMQDAVEALPEADRKDKAKVEAAHNAGWARGMGVIRQIAANARAFNEASSSLPGVISAGDVAAGMTIDFFARSQIQFVGDARMGYVEPANATVINPDPIAMIQRAPHAELARRFVEFVLSEEGQLLWNKKAGTPGGPRMSDLRRLPVRRGVYRDTAGWTDPVNPFEQSQSFNTSRSRTATFSILGEMIQASCIAPLESLRDTRQQLLDAGRSDLDAKLGVFPFDQAEALKRGAAWAKARPVERLEMMRTWTQQFRDEYRQLRDAAGQPETASSH